MNMVSTDQPPLQAGGASESSLGPAPSGRLYVRTGASVVLGTLPAPVPGADRRVFDARGIAVTMVTMRCAVPGAGSVDSYWADPKILPVLRKVATFRECL